MAIESARGLRGWIYAILVAICLVLLFFVGENLSRMKQPGYYHAARTITLSVSTTPKYISKIATEPLPLEIEPIAGTLELPSWIDYRSNPKPSLAMIEPPAGARLMAPTSTELGPDPFQLAIQQQRHPVVLAENAAHLDPATTATPVSSARALPTQNYTERWWVQSNEIPIVQSQSWPNPLKLREEIEQLRTLAESKNAPSVLDWTNRVTAKLVQLQQINISDEASSEHLNALQQLSVEGPQIADSVVESEPQMASEIARVSYSIERRLAVWNAVSHCVGKGRTHLVSARKHQVDVNQLHECLSNVRVAIQKTGDAPSWNQYLMLDSITNLANGTITGEADQVEMVRQFLSRVTDSRVSSEQRAVLTSAEVHKLADQLHPLSIGPVDYRKLIEDIEMLETDPVHRCSRSLADAMQSLRFSEHPEQAAVSNAIGVHYRNANLRVAVSEDFINRMMPKPKTIERPVRQSILGADTRGASQIETKLHADFQPDPNAWKIALKLDGDIRSNTKSSRSGATFYNSSIANVNAIRELSISPTQLQVNGRPATVDSNDSLRKFSTDWDSLPVLGDMVRHFAHQEFLQSRPIAKRLMQRTIAEQTDEEFDRQLQEKLKTAQTKFDTQLIGPLRHLDLNPMVVDMQSTETRLIARYRLASSDQLSAYTPRPLAPGDSHLSLQIHQSAFNNAVSQVVDGNRDWTMQELSDKVSDLLKLPRKPLDEDAPTDVIARFAEGQPITVEFEDGRMWLTLRLASLEQPGRIHLKNFIIRTSYVPTVNGLHAELVRDGVISVDGHKLGMRDRLPLRAIFSRVFANRNSISMVADSLLQDERAKGLAVSQLEMRYGWLAIAVSDESSPHIARR